MSSTIVERLDMTSQPEYTDEEIRMLEDIDDYPIVYDDDCPRLTKEQLSKFRRVSPLRDVDCAVPA